MQYRRCISCTLIYPPTSRRQIIHQPFHTTMMILMIGPLLHAGYASIFKVRREGTLLGSALSPSINVEEEAESTVSFTKSDMIRQNHRLSITIPLYYFSTKGFIFIILHVTSLFADIAHQDLFESNISPPLGVSFENLELKYIPMMCPHRTQAQCHHRILRP